MFHLLETTIAEAHAAYLTGEISCRRLTEWYLKRIDAYDRRGPEINSIITKNPRALDEADDLDTAFKARGLTGPLHGIPVVVKDQVDTVGMPTTLGSVLFENYLPDQDATVTRRLKAAGALILAKTTLGEMGRGDTHGTLFGSTRNPYDRERTVGGSSGGSAAALSANLTLIAVGQEGLASIRRPAAWNSTVGMRPTLGLVSRTGSFGGWPSRAGSLGPMTRTVEDAARLLDVMVGYDSADPSTAYGVGHIPASYTTRLDINGLRGVRVGVLRESIGLGSEPGSDDYREVTRIFDRAVHELGAAGAVIVDPVEIPGLDHLLKKRVFENAGEAFLAWMNRSDDPPFRSYEEFTEQPEYRAVMRRLSGGRRPAWSASHYEYLLAREELNANLLTVMADNELDVIVHKTVEHVPTLIRDGVNPPYVSHKGATHVNTFLIDVPSVSVPAGFTSERLPVGVTFLGRSFDDASMLRYAYAYERATTHRAAPSSTPALAGQP